MNKISFRPFTWNIRGQLQTFERPLLMGILNVTPDSFYAESRVNTSGMLQRAAQMLEDGADILDIGGQSTRPGSIRVSAEEEWKRISEGLTEIVKAFPKAIISVDTYHSSVAEKAIDAGASIINDISAGSMDKDMFKTVAKLHVPYVLMHMQGEPSTMQIDPKYDDVVGEVIQFLSKKMIELHLLGVHDIAVDPGFGFGKELSHNITLLKELRALHILEKPILVGMSRKKMIRDLGETSAEESLPATLAAHLMGLMDGASIVRVHDVEEHKAALRFFEGIKKGS